MTAQILDGELVAAAVKAELAERVAVLAERGVVPGLGTLLVGDDAPSAKYVAMKHREVADAGWVSRDVRLGNDATAADVAAAIETLNADASIHAYIVQYPFPAGLDYESLVIGVDPAKDADGLHPFNLGRLVMGAAAPVACTPAGIMRLLQHYDVPIAGAHVVIVGRGLTIGRPLANLVTLKHGGNAAVTVLHTGVAELAPWCRQADILVEAAGAPDLITPEMVRPGAAVVAAGVKFVDGKLRSDVAAGVEEVAGWLSPKVGGVGPMTRAMLMANTVDAVERSVHGSTP